MLVLIALSACSSAQPELEVRTVQTEIERPTEIAKIPDPAPVHLQDISWTVLTNENLPEEGEWVFIALTPDEYEQLSTNQAELLRWALEAKWRLRYYRGEVPAETIPSID